MSATKTQYLPQYTPAQFKKLSKKKQRVTVAEDVIAQLEAKTLKAGQGLFLDIYVDNDDNESFLEEDARKFFSQAPDKNIQCTACGLGSMMVAKARLENHATVDDVATDTISGEDIEIILMQIFSSDTIRNIEVCFEKGYGFYDENDDEDQPAIKFGKRFRNPNNRLIAICKNIIKNEGEFIP